MHRKSASKRGSKPADLSSLRELMKDDKTWCAIGVVVAREQADHYEFTDEGDILVDVDLGQEGAPVWCRLGGGFGGENIGMWRVPPVGSEVAVIVPSGHFANDPMIVAVLSSGAVPAELDDDPETLVIVNSAKIKIVTTSGNLEIDTDGDVVLQGGMKKVARVDDKTVADTTMATFISTVCSKFNATAGPMASAPGTITPPTDFGKISEGADKVKA